MRIIRGFQSYPPEAPRSVVALGAFDGIHLAHQKILGVAASRARAIGARALVCTFDPHPLQVLRPEQAPVPITTLDERLALIARHGIDTTVIIPFTPEFSRVEPEAFVKDVLLQHLRAREIVVGFNHTFGRGARGDAGLLTALAPQLGFVAHVISALTIGGVTVSSSAIREALRAGDVVTARRFLGRPYTIRGTVVRGAGRGRQLGFPTANIKPDRPVLVATGVYAGYARVGNDAATVVLDATGGVSAGAGAAPGVGRDSDRAPEGTSSGDPAAAGVAQSVNRDSDRAIGKTEAGYPAGAGAAPGVGRDSDRAPERTSSGDPAGAGVAQARVPAPYKSVVNIGYRPTFGEGEYWVEAYLIDFSADRHDQPISIGLTARIREERKVPDVEALRDQVSTDIATAAARL
jgi:riboflavin kinase/FMN adenylyltransferase